MPRKVNGHGAEYAGTPLFLNLCRKITKKIFRWFDITHKSVFSVVISNKIPFCVMLF